MNTTHRPRVPGSCRLSLFALAAFASVALVAQAGAQDYFNMAATNYSQTFTGWTNYATNWNGLAAGGTNAIPSPVRTTVNSTSIIAPSSSGGVQSTNTNTAIFFLSTGTTANTTSVGADLNLNFSTRTAGTITFDAATVFNSTGDRVGTLRLYYATNASPTNASDWTEITGTGLPYVATNNVAGSASVSATLPSGIDNQSTVKLRFYYYNGAGNGTTGSRPKISIDNLLVTSTGEEWSGPVITGFDPASGAAGTSVTIGGSNFTGATNVAFNGVSASFLVNSATNISATVPSGALTGPISVTSSNGTGYSTNSFFVPTVTVALPASVNEGQSGFGEVTLNEAAPTDVEVTLVSSSTNDLVVDSPVIIFEGLTSADFNYTAPLDNTVDGDTNVIVTPSAAGYAAVAATITVKNIDLPFESLLAGGYTQSFSGFTNTATLPLGWSVHGANTTYGGTWGTTPTGVKGGASVFGYQHTGDTGTVTQILTLKNETGAEITDLTVSYLGMVSRATEGRTPAYTVTVDGVSVPALAYSTASGTNEERTASISGLSIAVDEVFQIIWTSDRGLSGSGSSRQIGIGDFEITIGAAVLPPSVASLSIPSGTIGETEAEASADVTSDGGSPITARGFVYSVTSVNNDPTIGGTGVTNVIDGDPSTGVMNAMLTSLTASTQYSVKAYASNVEGTTYTGVQTFTTLAPAASFDGTYSYPFNAFSGVSGLPGEWTAISSGGVQGYVGDWTSGASTGGFYGNQSSPGVLGYTHTSGTGTLTVTLRLVNNTGSTLTELSVGYLGRVTQLANTRFPTWTVSLDGTPVASLAYTTESGEDEFKTATITDLSIPDGANFTLTWVSDRGLPTGSSRRIGMASVIVSTTPIGSPQIDVTGSLTPFSTTQGTPSASQSFSASGTDLVEDIVITAPADYEVSLNDADFSPSVNLSPTDGTVTSTPVYVRIAASAAVGNPAGQVNLASTGATSANVAVTGTVSAGGGGFASWVDGGPTNSTTVGLYAVGGATSPTANDGIPSVTTLTSSNLSITAIVRTNDPNLSVFGQATTDLSLGPWLTNGVTMTNSPNQSGVPEGTARQIFSIDRGTNSKLNLRLEAILAP